MANPTEAINTFTKEYEVVDGQERHEAIIDDGVQLYRGGLACVDTADGKLKWPGDSNTLVFAGVIESDRRGLGVFSDENLLGDDEKTAIVVSGIKPKRVNVVGASAASVYATVFAKDGQTLDIANGANFPIAGYITKHISGTLCEVKFNKLSDKLGK